ncbi:RagB/SusD family nutrient uptake outer membrane protein [Pontibacter cellulosilyticus]|uniref:RagB/SusD family nutrient uptake outer membrane protein n=1 Tax=Pontibacter cellulosilyticus TaxID=1720253 RepID=A0A923NA16_9BACT|nr:RagB/SusD family nutrient uptake outer membrane protein [Pontibacter cellulosilyticus]MBC5995031.1 RagB/SusD family nutrient uptake outer membrane protein [Pontibacter cellulosilyticus]
MKRYSIILLTALSLVTFSGCDDVLEVEPTTAIEAEGAISDFTTLQRAALGAYSAMQSTNYYGLRYLLYQGVYADNLEHRGTFTTDREVSARVINASNLQIANTWATIYTVINRANIVLRAADQLTNITDAQRKRIKGEMFFLRGLAYFDLVKVFGGVPVTLTPTTEISEIQNLPRSTESQVYDAVISDLRAAETQLTGVSNPKTRATSAAASALLARVYLQRGNYALAEEKANQVITSNSFALEEDFAKIFTTESGSEIIFEVDFTLNDQSGLGAASNPRTPGQKFYLRAGAYNALQASAQNGDERFAATTAIENSRRRLLKYEDVVNNADNVPVIRLAEMYLIRAEARARQGIASAPASPQVIADINRIRTRAGLPALVLLTNAQALTEILQQRRLEFIGEGLRFIDLKRYNLTCDVLDFCGEDAFRNLWPIPLQQIEVNPSLTQNPGY